MVTAVVFILIAGSDASAGSLKGVNPLFQFYRDHVSVVDGNRCAMVPSCSEYSRQAVEKHGAFLGWIMTCDRLVRCGRDEISLSRTVVIENESRTEDPLDANDFWWFNHDSSSK